MSTIPAIYEHGMFRPIVPVDLAENSQVELEIRKCHMGQTELGSGGQSKADQESISIEEKLTALAAHIPQTEWDCLPADLTDHLDHYTYGTPKG